MAAKRGAKYNNKTSHVNTRYDFRSKIELIDTADKCGNWTMADTIRTAVRLLRKELERGRTIQKVVGN